MIRAFIIVTLLQILFFHFYAPRFITEVKNPILSVFTKDRPLFDDVWSEALGSRQEFTFTSNDGLLLRGVCTKPHTDSIKATIILIHGIRSKKEHFNTMSKKLCEKGYQTVVFDLRAHGESEGVHCTFGIKERQDVKTLIDTLIQKYQIKTPIGIWGQSLGGSVALQSMAIDKRIKFGIVESTFSDFNEVTHEYFKRYFGFDIPFLTNYLIDRSGKIAGFEPIDAKTSDICTKVTQPVLLVHGNHDSKINVAHARKNYSGFQDTLNKQLLIIDGADHQDVWIKGGDEYFSKVISFINQY